MTSWLLPVKQALEESLHPVTFFFRDDDGGWEDARLFALMSLCSDYKMPLDIAVIPNEITSGLKRGLDKFFISSPQLFGIHQHGFAHINHESEGRKCEFGASRNFDQQIQDIAMGKEKLEIEFGESIDPIFTPPWNRCVETTAQCLIELGFKALSRDETAIPFGMSALEEIPVNIDWFAKKKGVALSKNEIGENIAKKIYENKQIGVMFHHALMDEMELAHVAELFELIRNYGKVEIKRMRQIGSDESVVNIRGVSV